MVTVKLHFIGSEEAPLEQSFVTPLKVGDVLKVNNGHELESWKVDEVDGDNIYVELM